jgi:hypothetical protein
MDFWERVKVEIRRLNTTQEWVANKAKLNFGSFRGWITKGRLPGTTEAVAIAQVLGVTVEYLLTGKDSSGLSPRLATLARKLVRLPDEDIEEIEALVDLKISRQDTQEAVDEVTENA